MTKEREISRRAVMGGGIALLAGASACSRSGSDNEAVGVADEAARAAVEGAVESGADSDGADGAGAADQSEMVVDHERNGDEELYPDGMGSFTKTLLHDDLGVVTTEDFAAFVAALEAGDPERIDALPTAGQRRLADPVAAHGNSLVGSGPSEVPMPAVHALASERQAAEAIEVYWKALTRDIPFVEWSSDVRIGEAVAELTALTDFTGPRDGDQITAGTLFRGLSPGDLVGPYVSQFLLVDIPHSSYTLSQAAPRAEAGVDFMTTVDEWLDVQRGAQPQGATPRTAEQRHIATGRDLADFVHADYSYQAYLNAALVCLSYGPDARSPFLDADAARRGAFVNHGGPDVVDLVARSATISLRVAWFHKWLVHRKLRPEALGGLVYQHLAGLRETPLSSTLLDSMAVEQMAQQQGTSLLGQAYAEGSPTHPSYPAGHATIAGAGVTVLKAHFRDDFVVPAPVVADASGSLTAIDEGLRLGDELNKLASNIAIGRNIAGVHWRADGDDGLVAGETSAIALLQDHLFEFSSNDGFYELTKFDGVRVRITQDAIEEIA